MMSKKGGMAKKGMPKKDMGKKDMPMKGMAGNKSMKGKMK